MELGYARTPLRRKLVEATLHGEKTATASLLTDYAPHSSEQMPVAGRRYVLVDYDDQPVAILETTEVNVVAAKDVDVGFARDEGEGFETVADWRAAHEQFWHDQNITDDTLVVCQRFRLVESNP